MTPLALLLLLASLLSMTVAERRFTSYTKAGHRQIVTSRRAIEGWTLMLDVFGMISAASAAAAIVLEPTARPVDRFITVSALSLALQVILHVRGPKER